MKNKKVILLLLLFSCILVIFLIYTKTHKRENLTVDVKQQVMNQIASISPNLLGLEKAISEYEIYFENQVFTLFDGSNYTDVYLIELSDGQVKMKLYLTSDYKNFYLFQDEFVYYFDLEQNRLIYSVKSDAFTIYSSISTLDGDVYSKLYNQTYKIFTEKTSYQSNHPDYKLIYQKVESMYQVVALHQNTILGSCNMDMDLKKTKCNFVK